MIKNEIKTTLIIILFWILVWIWFWSFLWYKILRNNYIVKKWSLVAIKNKIEQKNQNTLKTIEQIKNDTKMTKTEYEQILKKKKYDKNYLVLIDLFDNTQISKQINHWIIYWKVWKTKEIKTQVAMFIKNNILVKYIIKTKNKSFSLNLNCILNTTNIKITKLKKRYNRYYYCNKQTNNKYKTLYPYLFDKQYNNVLSEIIINKRNIWNLVTIWTPQSEIKYLITKYSLINNNL